MWYHNTILILPSHLFTQSLCISKVSFALIVPIFKVFITHMHSLIHLYVFVYKACQYHSKYFIGRWISSFVKKAIYSEGIISGWCPNKSMIDCRGLCLDLYKQYNPQFRCEKVFLNQQVGVRMFNFTIWSKKTEKQNKKILGKC